MVEFEACKIFWKSLDTSLSYLDCLLEYNKISVLPYHILQDLAPWLSLVNDSPRSDLDPGFFRLDPSQPWTCGCIFIHNFECVSGILTYH